jgi:hypothetical protein
MGPLCETPVTLPPSSTVLYGYSIVWPWRFRPFQLAIRIRSVSVASASDPPACVPCWKQLAQRHVFHQIGWNPRLHANNAVSYMICARG